MSQRQRPFTWQDVPQVLRFGAAQLLRSQAPVMAAALAFRTLFGLLPVLVVGTLLAKGIMGDEFPGAVASLVGQLGLEEIRVIPPADASGGPSPESVALGPWVQSLVTYAAGIDLAALGWVGIAVTIASAIWVMISIEESFNHIYHAPSGRPWVKRLLIYWFVLTVGPVAIAASPVMLNALAWSAHWTDGIPMLARILGWALSAGLTWGLILVAYMTVPNTRVRLRPAIVGALVAAVLVDFGKRSLGAYVENAFSVSRLYGSLGLVPLFMFWVYLMWLFILYGLQVSAILESIGNRGRSLSRNQHHGMDVFEPANALVALEFMAERFAMGRKSRPWDIASATGLTPSLSLELLRHFEVVGIATRLEDEEPSFTLARPIEDIDPTLALRAAFALIDGGAESPANDAVRDLRAAQLDATRQRRSG